MMLSFTNAVLQGDGSHLQGGGFLRRITDCVIVRLHGSLRTLNFHHQRENAKGERGNRKACLWDFYHS
jgi:hypothetical protein